MKRPYLLTMLLCTACAPVEDACPGEKGISADAAWPPSAMVRSQGQTIVDGEGAPLQLRCVNVDSWLIPIPYLVSDSAHALLVSPSEMVARLEELVGEAEAASFWGQWRERFITEADLERMAALGFNCARLVLYYRAITREDAEGLVLDDARLAHVDAAVGWARAHRLYLVLDLHTAPGGQNAVPTVSDVPSTDAVARLWEGPDAAANQDATVALWRALAARYRDETVVAAYDLLNEPALPVGVPKSALVDLYARIIAAVREVDPAHMLFLEGDQLAHDFSMFDAPLDDNMGYSFHAYALTGLEDWATPELADLQPYLDLRAAHDRPLWLGEFGEKDEAWQTQVVDLLEAHAVGWSLYPWKRKQTLFWNTVVQRIPDTPAWYAVAAYLLQPAGDPAPRPSDAQVTAGMTEILSAIELAEGTQDRALVNALLCR